MHYTWTWTYTIVVTVLLLVAFLLVGTLLLLRSRRGRVQRPHRAYLPTPESMSTPQGYYRVVNPQVSLDEGMRRAEHTSYFPRIEREEH